MPEPAQQISDPQSLRAMTHPLRLQLMDLLGADAELTATQCAERTGESVASCSFHLRMLAKYGFVEPGERRGREKPWKLVSRSRRIGPDWEDPASVRAASGFAQAVVDRETERLRRSIQHSMAVDTTWGEALSLHTASPWLTREELAEYNERLTALHVGMAERYADRNTDPAARPAGSRVVHLFAAASLGDEPTGEGTPADARLGHGGVSAPEAASGSATDPASASDSDTRRS